jgi:hypothetical protein
MPRLRRLSGSEVIRILEDFGFAVLTQRGSHVKLRRIGPAGEKQTGGQQFPKPSCQRSAPFGWSGSASVGYVLWQSWR